MKQMPVVLEEYGIAFDELRSLGGGESRAAQAYTGTRALMLAVLEDGISSYLNGKGRTRAEAEHWITTTLRRSPFSFVIVCETLGLEPQAVRGALRRMRETRAMPLRVDRPDGAADIFAPQFGQSNIREHELDIVCVSLIHGNSFFAVAGLDDPVARTDKELGEEVPQENFILNDQDRFPAPS